MNGFSLRDPQVLGTLAAAGACLGGIALYLALRKRPSPEEIERLRREGLMKTGRITDGTVLDVSDLDAGQCGRAEGMQLILYKYTVAGVIYECSQDVTHLRDQVDIHSLQVGFSASIRYDVHQPENSIIIAESWSGLRDTMQPFPMRQPERNPAAATVPRR